MRNTMIAGAVALVVSVAPAFARVEKPNTTPTLTTDQAFVTDAARADMAEVAIGKLAEARASNHQVKAFAKQMVNDHQQALHNLTTVASEEKVPLPTVLDPRHRAIEEQLGILPNRAFDRVYMNMMINDNRQDLAEFRTESQDAKAADVRQYASSRLPMLEAHVKLAQTTDNAVIGAADTSTAKKPVAY